MRSLFLFLVMTAVISAATLAAAQEIVTLSTRATSIKIPVLLVHHLNDACRETPYREAKQLAEGRNYPFITVHGGKPPTAEPCEGSSYHGYLGKEGETADAIVKWILKKPYPANIE